MATKYKGLIDALREAGYTKVNVSFGWDEDNGLFSFPRVTQDDGSIGLVSRHTPYINDPAADYVMRCLDTHPGAHSVMGDVYINVEADSVVIDAEYTTVIHHADVREV